jgi:hypothetical protein
LRGPATSAGSHKHAASPSTRSRRPQRIAAVNGRRRYSLFTGDLGTALFAAACLDEDTRYPIIDVI